MTLFNSDISLLPASFGHDIAEEERKRKHREYYEAHKEQYKATNERWRLSHSLEWKAIESKRNKKRYREYQRRVFFHYSNGTMRCVSCGFDDIRALSIDHINGGGEEERRKHGGSHEYLWLINHKFPSGIQILCMNCQFIKRHEENEFPNQNGMNKLLLTPKQLKSRQTINF